MITVKEKINTTICKKCSNTLIFDNDDVKEINCGGWEEYIVVCPKCNNRNQVCYINGKWQ